ncbi:tyrosine-type recombinase/integrase [Dolosigranulum pigrum]|uniref:tyrosine-type recombinase/integrase n=1 Tax=Dolosigranulum pigrum TaxID=29394 RepID=UPI001AD8804B|nr:phage integrase SAM-like domain-containing protein [Dolosigranulum pigrum]QTJ33530.1 hypothetical protein FE321_07975 [Dolosigranulum pigrum]
MFKQKTPPIRQDSSGVSNNSLRIGLFIYIYFIKNKEELLWRASKKIKMVNGFAKEAQVVAAELELQAENDFKTQTEDIIFADYFQEWVEQYKIDTGLSTITENKYLYNVQLVRDFFKQTKLVELTRLDYQRFLNHRGKDKGKDVVSKTHYALKGCLKLALADGLITKDPTYGAQLNHEHDYSSKTKFWSEQEAQQLNQYFLSNCEIKHVMLYIALNTGMRIGEVFALGKNDITRMNITSPVERINTPLEQLNNLPINYIVLYRNTNSNINKQLLIIYS